VVSFGGNPYWCGNLYNILPLFLGTLSPIGRIRQGDGLGPVRFCLKWVFVPSDTVFEGEKVSCGSTVALSAPRTNRVHAGLLHCYQVVSKRLVFPISCLKAKFNIYCKIEENNA